MASNQPYGVHLVGSINLPSTKDVFNEVPRLLPRRLRRIPDGETGVRNTFTMWQLALFGAAPETMVTFDKNGGIDPGPVSLSPQQISQALDKLGEIFTHYDDAALQSYALFTQFQSSGHIDPTTRFQVSLPGICDVLGLVARAFQPTIEPLYEGALIRSLERIQSSIPHSVLSIQIDAAIEILFIEGGGPFQPYFEPIFDGVIDRLSRFANLVSPDVELGFHLCYGDLEHRHFVEPYDMGTMVEVANALCQRIDRPIQWLHMPVPKGRKDEKYFAPLRELNTSIKELHLGVVHERDLEGTRERIAVAARVLGDRRFGVATECGMGRTPEGEFGNIMEILKTVSEPVT